MAGLYFHIPFCRRVCAYCDFYKSVDLRCLAALPDALCRELDARCGELRGEAVATLYFGGGTPSLLPAEAVWQIIGHAARRLDCSQLGEVTLEANPDDLTPAYLAALREAGVNRLSVGIQSFDDEALRRMNRRHTAAQAVAAVEAARAAGFGNLSIDLIFGIPGFGGEVLRRSLDEALRLGVEHISAYHLTIEPDTAFGRMAARGTLRPVDEQTSEQEFARVHETLASAGYDHYEVSNFARAGFRARHNAAYWHDAAYLGLGPAAHSFDGRVRQWNVASVAAYIEQVAASGRAIEGSERLTERDRYNEYLLTRLRTSEGIDPGQIARRFGEQRAARLHEEARKWLQAGALRLDAATGRLHIPAERFLISDAVIEALFESGV